MRVLPILFNIEMVRALLDNRKTATRRVIKPQPEMQRFGDHEAMAFVPPAIVKGYEAVGVRHTEYLKSPYQIGDILYVREMWRVGTWDIPHQMIAFDYADGTCGQLVYIASREMFMRLVDQSCEDARKAKCVYNGVDFVWEKGKSPCRWRPSIHMPREAARIWLRVTDMRAERLQGITPEDVCNEGQWPYEWSEWMGKDVLFPDWREEFAELWDGTIKRADRNRYGWAANPWVWVIEFERCKKPEEADDMTAAKGKRR